MFENPSLVTRIAIGKPIGFGPGILLDHNLYDTVREQASAAGLEYGDEPAY